LAETIIGRIETLQFSENIFNPLEPLSPSTTRQRLNMIALLSRLVLVFGLLALLSVVSDVFRDLLKEEWAVMVKDWTINDPTWTLVLLVAVFGMLRSLIIWLVKALKNLEFYNR